MGGLGLVLASGKSLECYSWAGWDLALWGVHCVSPFNRLGIKMATDDCPAIEICTNGPCKQVRIYGPRARSHYDAAEFSTSWPDNLLYALAELKGEWFCDS